MNKIIPRKNYGSIPHLPGSRKNNPSDKIIHDGNVKIATQKTRDKNDLVIVQEKLDGSNVGVLRKDDYLYTLTRSGNLASESRFDQHIYFDKWVQTNYERFFQVLNEGERLIGEWLVQAHGTKYDLPHEPFVVFDLVTEDQKLLNYSNFINKVDNIFPVPKLLHYGEAISIETIMKILGDYGFHGALEKPEGAVWRVERNGKIDFLCKFVREDKIDGCYLEELILNTWKGLPDKDYIYLRR